MNVKLNAVGTLLTPFVIVLSLAYPHFGNGSENVKCIRNGDGTVSCQRLSDNKWFHCTISTGSTSTCKSVDGEPITCVRTGNGISSCSSNELKNPSLKSIPSPSVF